MANYRYFADVDGKAIQLSSVYHDGHVSTKVNHFFGRDDAGNILQATRMIEYKSQPSRHECDARCINATGKIMRCECSCGGKNHGRGAFVCSAI